MKPIEQPLESLDISLRDQDLPFIGTEETFSTHELMVLNDRLFLEDTGLAEIGPRRIGAMDEAGLNVQILSAHTPGVQNVPGQEGIDFAYRLNKMLVDGPMATYPGRFQAFATLPLQSPEASADELERAVREDGFLGCLTNGIIGKKFLDHPDFEPVLARAEALDVPIYMHPGLPPDEVFQIYYSTTRSEYQKEYQDQILSISAYGWHQEVAHSMPSNDHVWGIRQISQTTDHHRPHGRGSSVLLRTDRERHGRSDRKKPGEAVRAVLP